MLNNELWIFIFDVRQARGTWYGRVERELTDFSLSVFYLNVAIHHEVTTALTSHLGRLIMDPPLWIWLISSLFQIYYTVGPKVEMQWMVRVWEALPSTEYSRLFRFPKGKLTLSTSTDLTIKVHIYSKLRTTIITLGKEINFQFNFVIWDFWFLIV